MFNILKESMSSTTDTSNMRVLVTICVCFAMLLSTVITTIWVFSFIYHKPMADLGLMVGLVGTLLSTVLSKALQSFPENKYKNRDEERLGD